MKTSSHRLAMEVAMRRLALALVSLLFLACSKEPAAPDAAMRPAFAATSDWTDEVLNLPLGDFRFYVPCVNDTLDEAGPVLLSSHTVTTANGTVFFVKIRDLDGFHLVGDATGIWNPVSPNQQGTLFEKTISLANGSYSSHFNLDPYLIVNEVSGTRINFPVRITVTINANGQITVDRDREPCSIVGN